MTTTGRIFHYMCHDGEAILVEQGTVFGAVEACVVERLAFES